MQDLYERIYSCQYVLYIIVILAFSTFVLLLYAPLSPCNCRRWRTAPLRFAYRCPARCGADDQRVIGRSCVWHRDHDISYRNQIIGHYLRRYFITVATLLTTTAIISPSQPITMTTATTTTLPIPGRADRRTVSACGSTAAGCGSPGVLRLSGRGSLLVD